MNRINTRRLVTTYIETPVARVLARLGLSPNIVTLMGLIGAGISAYLLSIGRLWEVGIVLLVAGTFDLFDGALARATDRTSALGAFLDSVSDRVSELVVLFGLLIYYSSASSTKGIILVYLALSASLMVSYLRARAEGLGIDCKVGVMTRPERIAILGVGLVVAEWWLTAILVILATIAGLGFVTLVQRLAHVCATLRERD